MSRNLHIHVEEPSMEAFLEGFLPRLLTPSITTRIINHQSKKQLLVEIPKRLTGYAKLPIQVRPKSLILIDRDSENCTALKARLEEACCDAGLSSKTNPAQDGSFEVVNRIVIEELEAWYFGAIPALSSAFPGVPLSLAKKAKFREPDAIKGGTHEQFLKILQKAGHYKGLSKLPKISTARQMGLLIDPVNNRSSSFAHFVSGLQSLTL